MTALNGETTNFSTAFPTPTTPPMIFWKMPDDERNAEAFVMRSATHPAMVSSRPEKKSMTGCRASMPFLIPAIAVSFSFRESASFIATLARMPMVARAGDAAMPSSPPFTPCRPPFIALKPLSSASVCFASPFQWDS